MNKLQALELSSGLANLVTGMEDELLRNIAAYLLSGNGETEASKWKIRKLAELGKLNKKNIETIKSYIPYEKDMAELTLKRAAVDAFAHAESGFRRMVIDGLVKDAPTGSMDATMQRTLKMLGKQAATDLNLVNTTMQIKARQMANTAVHKAASLAGNQDFLDMLNRAAGKTVTGTESMTAAVSTCLKDMAQKGIPGFVDKSGRKWTPEAYVNMCVRTTASNTANQTMFERMKDYTRRIIEVSSHSGARPKCAKDQGKLYDLDNGSGYVEDVNGKKIRYYPFSSTSYGKPDGLFGINCGHHMYPFVPGCSTQKYFPYDEEENAAQYKKVQKQRELERKVRASKRECMMLKDGDPEAFQKASVKLKHNTQQLKTYCSSNDLTYMNERTTVMGYGRSEAGKVTAAYNRALKQEQEKLNKVVDISGGSGIINEDPLFRKKSNENNDFKPVSEKRFNNLTIMARKNGANIIRNDPQFNERLRQNNASAVTYGDTIVFAKEATVSDILEETYHFMQNKNGTNNDKPDVLRVILNEIDAKQYLLDNAKKFYIPRKETELTLKQLRSYQKQLEKFNGG